VIQEGNPLLRSLIPRIEEIPKGSDKCSRPNITRCLFGLIDRTGGCATGAEDATNRLFQKTLVLRRLSPFLIRRKRLSDQIRLNGVIFFEEGVEIYDQIFHHPEYLKRLDQDLLLKITDQLLTR
jgi:hypothetical protein